MAPEDFAYVVPLRRWTPGPIGELANYLAALPQEAEVIVVDGSAPAIFAAHGDALPKRVRHLSIPPERATANGKVGGVIEGIRATRHERIVLADDDVRYDAVALSAIVAKLSKADVVRPQNYFSPAPWHAQWDTARMLLNRVSGGDWPGTLAVRRSTFLRAGGYSGDVLFENFELVRSIVRCGGREEQAPGIYVRRLPPEFERFLDQRVRQAYDEFARPLRMALFLSLVPAAMLLGARRAWSVFMAVAVVLVAIAEAGRRRSGGTRYFSPLASLLAPLWVLERAVCSWLAVCSRAYRGGMPYAGAVLKRAAT